MTGRLRPLDAFLHLAAGCARPRPRMIGDRLALGAEEAGDLRRVLDQMLGLVGQIHLHQHIAGKEFALGVDLCGRGAPRRPPRSAPAPPRTGRRGRAAAACSRIDSRDLALEVRIGVHDVPAHVPSIRLPPRAARSSRRQRPGSSRPRERTASSDDHHHEHHAGGDHGLSARRPGDLADLLAGPAGRISNGADPCHFILYREPLDRRASRLVARSWQEWRDSNPQPPVLETGALAN